MLKKLYDKVDVWSISNSRENLIDFLLDTIELQGMLPPGYLKPIPFESDGRQYPLVPGDFKNDAGIWCTPGINEWEPENV